MLSSLVIRLDPNNTKQKTKYKEQNWFRSDLDL